MSEQTFVDARDLWASQGMPYFEPDRVTQDGAATIFEMLHVGLWRTRFGLQADALVMPYSHMASEFGLKADATIVSP